MSQGRKLLPSTSCKMWSHCYRGFRLPSLWLTQVIIPYYRLGKRRERQLVAGPDGRQYGTVAAVIPFFSRKSFPIMELQRSSSITRRWKQLAVLYLSMCNGQLSTWGCLAPNNTCLAGGVSGDSTTNCWQISHPDGTAAELVLLGVRPTPEPRRLVWRYMETSNTKEGDTLYWRRQTVLTLLVPY